MILKPSHLTTPQLYQARLDIFTEFVNSPEYQARVRDKIRRNPNFEQGFRDYFELLRQRGVMHWEL